MIAGSLCRVAWNWTSAWDIDARSCLPPETHIGRLFITDRVILLETGYGTYAKVLSRFGVCYVACQDIMEDRK